MKRIDSHRTGIATVVFACVLCAHVALPQIGTFAVVLLVLTGMTLAALKHPRASESLHLTTFRPAAAPSDVALPDGRDGFVADAELAGIEAELHTLVDQYRTEIEPAVSSWQAIAGMSGQSSR